MTKFENTEIVEFLNAKQLNSLIKQAINVYQEKFGIDKTYDMLFSTWNLGIPIKFKKCELINPDDIGKQKYSSVTNSNFYEYSYYNTIIDIMDEQIEFIYMLSDYYSGGWN